jgi:hypothetical protein
MAEKLRGVGFVDVSVEPFDFLHPRTPTRLLNLTERWAKRVEKMPLLRELAGSLVIQCRKKDH